MKQLLTDLGIALNFDFSYSFKGQIITLKDTVLTIDGRPVNLNSDEVKLNFPILSNKQTVKALFNNLFESVAKTKRNYFEKFEDNFDLYLSQTKYLIAIEGILLGLQKLNVGYGSDLLENVKASIHSTLRQLMYSNSNKEFSIPQRYVLAYDSEFFSKPWLDLADYIDSVKDDTSKLDKFEKELDTFDYTPYLTQEQWASATQEVYSQIADIRKEYQSFRELRDLLGDKIVELTSRKMTIRYPQLSRGNVWGWIQPLIADLKNKGIVVTVPKSLKLRDKYERQQELTQVELLSLIKTCPMSDMSGVFEKLEYETQILLLDIQTKTVKERLSYSNYRGASLMTSLLEKVTAHKDTVSFKKILGVTKFIPLPCLITFSDDLTVTEFLEHLPQGNPIVAIVEIPDKMFQEKLLKIPQETRYSLNYSITQAYVTRMSKTQKEQFLKSYSGMWNTRLETLKECAEVNYSVIKDFLMCHPQYHSAFIEVVLSHKDKATLNTLLKAEARWDNDLQKKIFKMLTIKEKLEALKSIDYSVDVGVLEIADSDMQEFLKACVTTEKLYQYTRLVEAKQDTRPLVEALDKIADYKIPASEYLIKNLPKELVIKTLGKDGFTQESARYCGYSSYENSKFTKALQQAYDRLTRKDIEEAHGKDLSNLTQGKYFAKHLTSQELETYKDNREFIRYTIDILPLKFLESFKNSEKYKWLVGDRRDSGNSNIGKTLDQRIGC